MADSFPGNALSMLTLGGIILDVKYNSSKVNYTASSIIYAAFRPFENFERSVFKLLNGYTEGYVRSDCVL